MTTPPRRRTAGRIIFALLLGLHALIHLLGAAQGLGNLDIPELTRPVSTVTGVLWLTAAAVLILGAGYLLLRPRQWWIWGAAGALVSQAAVIISWPDAAYGTIANALVFLAALCTYLTCGPRSFNARYDRDVAEGRDHLTSTGILTDADIVGVPEIVQRYIRRSGAVGLPRVQNFSARFHGQIRSGPSAPWMPFTGQQSNFYAPVSRFFLMDATWWSIPVQAFHRFVGSSASMRVKVAAAATVVDAEGPAMDRAETVTLFNDLCIFAPGVLVDSEMNIRWTEIDAHTVEAAFTHASRTVTARLTVNGEGDLTNFTANGRSAMSADGKVVTPMPWSTPLGEYRQIGAHRLMGSGTGIWHAPGGDYAYLRFVLDTIDYNLAGPARTGRQRPRAGHPVSGLSPLGSEPSSP